MSFAHHHVDTYTVKYYTHGTPYCARIECFEGSEVVCKITFFKQGKEIPHNSIVGTDINLNYPISQFNDVMTIFRQGKDIRITYEYANSEGHIHMRDKQTVGKESSSKP